MPVVTDPPLARALHSSTEIGQVIPEELYAAVAQVLAFVYRMAGRRRLALMSAERRPPRPAARRPARRGRASCSS